ncbi:MAG: ribonuclease Z [Methylovirgula sp.]
MRPLLHPTLLNGRFGDPVLCLETLFEKQIMLCDLGTVDALSPRQIQRVEHIFVSHTHIDHFFGFDRILRILVGRQKQVRLYGPPDFADRVWHKLHGYQWNLAASYLCDLSFVVTEIDPSFVTRTVSFRMKNAFAPEEIGCGFSAGGLILDGPSFRVLTAVLEHRTPCLAFAIEEVAHVNIWKTELAKLGLPVGPWLHDLKRAVLDNAPDDLRMRIEAPGLANGSREIELGALRNVYRVTPGQKIGYVTDIADTADNRRGVIQLVGGADILFIEAPFAGADRALAVERAHLTTVAAGDIARAAKARHVEPFHFSPRYAGQEQRMVAEVAEAFAGVGRPETAREGP